MSFATNTYFFDLSWGWRRVEKIPPQKSFFLFQKQQLCVRFCVLAVVAPKTMIFEKNHIFHEFRTQKPIFAQN